MCGSLEKKSGRSRESPPWREVGKRCLSGFGVGRESGREGGVSATAVISLEGREWRMVASSRTTSLSSLVPCPLASRSVFRHPLARLSSSLTLSSPSSRDPSWASPPCNMPASLFLPSLFFTHLALQGGLQV